MKSNTRKSSPQLCVKNAALKLHDAGWWIVPCNGKVPVAPEWPNKRVTRSGLSNALQENPKLDIAFVVNQSPYIDVEYDGDDGEMALLKLFHGELPKTPTWKSKRGLHRLFRRPEGLPRKSVIHLGEIEFRIGNGKDAVSTLPPSGGRRWIRGLSLEDIEPAELPKDVVALLRASTFTSPAVDMTGSQIPTGRRNDTLFAMACAMRRHGASDTTIEAALSGENDGRCTPPLSKGEIDRIVSSAVSYDAGEFTGLVNLLEPPSLGQAAYHGFAGELLDKVSAFTEATDPAILGQFLSISGCLAGQGVTIFAGSPQPPRVNIAVVGPTSSGRKGTSLSVLEHLFDRLPDHPIAQLYPTLRVTGLSTGEGIIKAVANERRKHDAEAADTFEDEKRRFVVEPELSKILAQTKRDGNILSHILRECFDSGRLQTLVAHNPLRADNAHIVVCGHITPEELRSQLNVVDMANGFANRFLWLYVNSDKLLPEAGPIPAEIADLLSKEWCTILESMPKLRQFTRDRKAKELWHMVYPSLREAKAGLKGAIVARGETIVSRLALIYCLLDRSKRIRQCHLEAALALWQYSVESVELLFADRTGDSLTDRLLMSLRNGPLTKREMYSQFSKPAHVLDAALAELGRLGLVHKIPSTSAGPGRPAQVWAPTPVNQIKQ